jgi:hypothetical protein
VVEGGGLETLFEPFPQAQQNPPSPLASQGLAAILSFTGFPSISPVLDGL